MTTRTTPSMVPLQLPQLLIGGAHTRLITFIAISFQCILYETFVTLPSQQALQFPHIFTSESMEWHTMAPFFFTGGAMPLWWVVEVGRWEMSAGTSAALPT